MNSKNDFSMASGYLPPYPNINSTIDYDNSIPLSQSGPTAGTPPSIARNQVAYSNLDEVELNNIRKSLKSNGQFVCCPYCKYQSVSRVEKTCNTGSVLCCVLFGGFAWLMCQALRSKDINCYNADHFCIRCGKQLAEYKAC